MKYPILLLFSILPILAFVNQGCEEGGIFEEAVVTDGIVADEGIAALKAVKGGDLFIFDTKSEDLVLSANSERVVLTPSRVKIYSGPNQIRNYYLRDINSFVIRTIKTPSNSLSYFLYITNRNGQSVSVLNTTDKNQAEGYIKELRSHLVTRKLNGNDSRVHVGNIFDLNGVWYFSYDGLSHLRLIKGYSRFSLRMTGPSNFSGSFDDITGNRDSGEILDGRIDASLNIRFIKRYPDQQLYFFGKLSRNHIISGEWQPSLTGGPVNGLADLHYGNFSMSRESYCSVTPVQLPDGVSTDSLVNNNYQTSSSNQIQPNYGTVGTGSFHYAPPTGSRVGTGSFRYSPPRR